MTTVTGPEETEAVAGISPPEATSICAGPLAHTGVEEGETVNVVGVLDTFTLVVTTFVQVPSE